MLIALLVLCFGLAAYLETWFQGWQGSRTKSADVLNTLLGDSRRMFANHFYVKADEYYHSGFYPTIFDNRQHFETPHMAADTGAVQSNNHGEDTGFLGQPRDWIDAFGRHFIPNRHTHLDEGGPSDDLSDTEAVGEILPWLKLSTELDPNNVQTYVVTAYWLRVRMNKTAEAEQVLREGLRQNPRSYEILFELGRLYSESKHDVTQARNVWELGARYWQELDAKEQEENPLPYEQITAHLGQLEEDAGNWQAAIKWYQIAQKHSLTPDALQKGIDEIRVKMAGQTNPPAALPR